MTKLNEIDAQIEALKLKKKKIQSQEAQDLYKSISSLLGDDFSSPLVLGIITKAIKDLSANPDLKEVWKKSYIPFRKSKGDFSNKNKKN